MESDIEVVDSVAAFFRFLDRYSFSYLYATGLESGFTGFLGLDRTSLLGVLSY